MSSEPFGRRWAGAAQSSCGRQLQEEQQLLRALSTPAKQHTHHDLIASRSAARFRVAVESTSEATSFSPFRRTAAESQPRPPFHAKPAWDTVQPLLHDEEGRQSGATGRSSGERDAGAGREGGEGAPLPRGPRQRTTRAAAQRKPTAANRSRADLLQARSAIYAAQQAGVAQPERFADCMTDCIPLSRLLLRSIEGGTLRRYEEKRLDPQEAFEAYPSLPLSEIERCLDPAGTGTASGGPKWSFKSGGSARPRGYVQTIGR